MPSPGIKSMAGRPNPNGKWPFWITEKYLGSRLTPLPARHFVPTRSDKIQLSLGACNQTGSFTTAALVRRYDSASGLEVINHATSGGSTALRMGITTSGLIAAFTDAGGINCTALAAMNQRDFYIIVITKTAGTTTPRGHVFYPDGTWQHADFGGTLNNPVDQSGGSIWLGTNLSTNFTPMDLAVAAEWNVALNDSQVQELSSSLRTLDWIQNSGGAPVGLWELDGLPASALQDKARNGANELTSGVGDRLLFLPAPWRYSGFAPGGAAEADTAQALDIDKRVTLVPASETDTAITLSITTGGSAQHKNLTPATETDSAQSLIINKLAKPTPASETDTAQALNVDKKVALSPASETDTAQTQNIDKKKTLVPATETDTAKSIIQRLRAALETDTAQALNVDKKVSLTPASETDTAQAIRPAHKRTVTPASETDSAVAIDYDKHRTFTPASETDTAQSQNVDKKVTLTPASETDTAQGLVLRARITPATETDTAVALSFTKPIFKTLTPATETDTAQAQNVDKRVTLGKATETDTAQTLNVPGKITLVPAAEADSAQALSYNKPIRKSLIPATETDTGRALKITKLVRLVPAAEQDGAVFPQRIYLVAVQETDTAQPLTVIISGHRWPGSTDNRWPGDTDGNWPADDEEKWPGDDDSRWLATTESRW